MTSQAKLRGLGIAPAVALEIVGDQSSGFGLTATGATQATAAPFFGDVNVFNNVAAGTGGILPPQREIGDLVEVVNIGVSALTVYPPLGSNISTLALNAGFPVPANKTCRFRLINILAGNLQTWMPFLSA